MSSNGIKILQSLHALGGRAALADLHGAYSYGALASGALRVSSAIQAVRVAPSDGRPPRIAYMCPRDNTYVQSQLATWHYGGIGVPIAEGYPPSEIEYILRDCGVSAVLSDATRAEALAPVAAALGIPCVNVDRLTPTGKVLSDLNVTATGENPPAPFPAGMDGAILIYTSGTTGRPKGVLTTHAALSAQVNALRLAWDWTPQDHIYSVLPLHHVHGVVALLNSALWSGAVCEIAHKFSATDTWAALTRLPDSPAGQLTLFMAVPTVFAMLLDAFDKQPVEIQERWRAALRPEVSKIRLMVSGSAALPQSVADRWLAVTGHRLLERYGECVCDIYTESSNANRSLN